MAQAQALIDWTRVIEQPWSLNALEAVFREHHGKVFGAALRVTGNAMDAEDALQTVFLKLARGARAGVPTDSDGLGRYLQRAGVNAALDALRSAHRHPAQPIATVPEIEFGTDGPDAAGPWIRARLRRAIAGLASRPAEMFVLRYVEGFSNREIGTMLGTSESVVGVTLLRARAQVRAALGAEHDHPIATDIHESHESEIGGTS